MNTLMDEALVVRGGLNLPEQFATGAGVIVDEQGKLHHVSVNCADGKTVEELAVGILHGQIGTATLREIRAAGADVLPDASPNNPYHSLLNGITAQTAHVLFTPTVANPARRKKR